MRYVFGPLLPLITVTAVAWAQSPFDSGQPFKPAGAIDEKVLAVLQKQGLTPSNQCSDEVFVRRVYLDVIGTLPTSTEADAFLKDQQPNKRALLIDALLQRDEFGQYWGLKWGDLLRVKSEFPIKLWPNAVQAYDHWIRDAMATNMPYDQFARALLTSSGSNFRVPPVNFYRGVQERSPVGLASAVALAFMGTRLDKWPETMRNQMATFFSRVAYKSTGEWKEEIVYPDPAKTDALPVVFPDGSKLTIPAGKDPREVFTDWLLAPENVWFGRAIANRVWSWLMGRGIIHEPDDIRSTNLPVNPELLAYLQKELVAGKYDLKHLFRLILNSATYQQSAIPASKQPDVEAYFGVYPVRRLDAEVLLDALCWLGGDGQGYCSQVPEPFTWIPENQRAITIMDGSITSAFLEMFGRPPRDTGLESERNNQSSDAQELYLLNSVDMHQKVQRSKMFAKFMMEAKGDRATLVGSLYLAILSRRPTEAELTAAEKHFQTPGLSPKQAVDDLAWALINSKEFLFRH
ncbi:MAG: DUF1549 and DUF1553 domain-containing protein [Armatimonadetes bacterium]|nr:DUF1549 and DUF1553 domain-containing protein [Armatimonadota bacterium]